MGEEQIFVIQKEGDIENSSGKIGRFEYESFESTRSVNTFRFPGKMETLMKIDLALYHEKGAINVIDNHGWKNWDIDSSLPSNEYREKVYHFNECTISLSYGYRRDFPTMDMPFYLGIYNTEESKRKNAIEALEELLL